MFELTYRRLKVQAVFYANTQDPLNISHDTFELNIWPFYD